MKYKPNCIKCRKQYDSDEQDDYYCSDCLREKEGIAKRVDKILASKPSTRPAVSQLAQYNSFNNGGHVNIKDMGIEL